MRPITPHLWFDTQAVEAARLYTSVFEDSEIANVTTLRDTPSGDCDIVSFVLAGQAFQAISAGPLFRFNPSVSFRVDCRSAGEVDRIWGQLVHDVLMPLDAYPFSPRYGWLQDRYGLSWQVMHAGDREVTQRIVPSLMFTGEMCGKAEEAIGFYASVFDGAGLDAIDRYGPGEQPDAEGTARYAAFHLEGVSFAAIDSAHEHGFSFNEAISFMVSCDTQEQIDRYWERLTAVPESEQCGWLKDRYGLSWQIVPAVLDKMLGADDATVARITQTFLPMKKLDIATLEQAYAGSA